MSRSAMLWNACYAAPNWELVIQRIAPNMELRDIVYGAAAYLNGGEELGLASIMEQGLLPDALTEAICYAESLDSEVEERSVPCPSCGEPNDPEEDCEFFGCNKCGKEVCENCATGGMCEACEAKHRGIVTVRFK